MSWLDGILNSSTIVWLIILIAVINIYLKKTGQTLPELITSIKESIQAMGDKE